MAAKSLDEFLDQVRSRLGLSAPALEQMSKQIGKLDLSDDEVLRLVDSVNLELARIYAERHVAMHRVKHDVVETVETVDSWEPDGKGGSRNKPVKSTHRTNAIDACPDCTRPLIAARDGDSSVPVLVCGRLEGLRVDLVGLTPHDVVACGIGG
jgi:hypothetical protein